jgi:putative membrane protein
MHDSYFWGMNWIWWILWLVLLFWIFVTPWNVPGQRVKKDTPLDILKKRFAKGEINEEEYREKKKLLEQ